MTRIFLIGYMGAGKTTLGKAFSRELGLTFIDLDWYIEERFHKTVQQLFSERGEQGFRELEQKMLHEISTINVFMRLQQNNSGEKQLHPLKRMYPQGKSRCHWMQRIKVRLRIAVQTECNTEQSKR